MSTEVFLASMAAILLAAILIYAMTRVPKCEARDERRPIRDDANHRAVRNK